MASSSQDLNQFEESPQSPISNWPGLDDIPSNFDGIFESQNDDVDNEEGVEQPNNIPDLNLPPPESQAGLQGPSFLLKLLISILLFRHMGFLSSWFPSLGRYKELDSATRRAAYSILLGKQKFRRLKRTATRDVAEMFGVSIRSMQRLWKRGRDSGEHDHSSSRVTNCGRKRVEHDLEKIRDIPLRHRTTIRSLAYHLGVSRRFVSQKLKEGVIRRHSNSIKPILTPANLTSRINHCLSHFEPTTIPTQPTFKHMENIVHIDEKWFHLSKRSQNYYLLAGETDPVRTSKNSNFIPKVMFLAAVARPRYDSNGICTFDGKIGVFPLVEHVAAVRSSQNRPRGTMEMKPIAAITRQVIRDFMILKILPAIANKWPRDSLMDPIFIQQDNAPSHILADDVEFLCAVEASGLNVSLLSQPPNSPDLNILDLGFFRAIQSLQSKECAKNVVDLVAHVEDAYLKFKVEKSNRIFLTLQSCMIEVLKCLGSNCYKIPHMKKEALARTASLPSTLQCCPEIYATAMAVVSP